jgi:hypothetical protein
LTRASSLSRGMLIEAIVPNRIFVWDHSTVQYIHLFPRFLSRTTQQFLYRSLLPLATKPTFPPTDADVLSTTFSKIVSLIQPRPRLLERPKWDRNLRSKSLARWWHPCLSFSSSQKRARSDSVYPLIGRRQVRCELGVLDSNLQGGT